MFLRPLLGAAALAQVTKSQKAGEPIVFLADRPLGPGQGHVHGPAESGQDLAGRWAGAHRLLVLPVERMLA